MSEIVGTLIYGLAVALFGLQAVWIARRKNKPAAPWAIAAMVGAFFGILPGVLVLWLASRHKEA